MQQAPCKHIHNMSILLVVTSLVGISSCECVRSLQGLDLAAAALQGPMIWSSRAANVRRRAAGDKTMAAAALQMARLYRTNLVNLKRGCPVLTKMRGRRSSLAQV